MEFRNFEVKTRYIKKLYNKKLEWFEQEYGVIRTEESGFPLFCGTSASWTRTHDCERVICGGPCLDHAIKDGPKSVSFQIAAEAAMVVKYAAKHHYRIFLFVMGSCFRSSDDYSKWQDMLYAYKSMLYRLCILFQHNPSWAVCISSWEDEHHWEKAREVYPIAYEDYIFQTLYKPSKCFNGSNSAKVILSTDLQIHYHNNLLAYHYPFIQSLCPWKNTRIEHVENIQQIRAFSFSAKHFNNNNNQNAHTFFLPLATKDNIRMTRGKEGDRLSASMGVNQIKDTIKENDNILSYLHSYLKLDELDELIDIFVQSFGEKRRF